MNYVNGNIQKTKDFLENHRSEITSIILSFAVLSVWLNVGFAIFLFAGLVVHEGGHAWALIKKGIGIKGIYFFIIGGGVSPKRQFKSYDETAFVAIMGSVFTMFLIAALFLAWYMLNIELFADMIIFLSTITLFNLLPYAFLDGGLIRDSIQKSNKFGQSLFIVPELIAASFLMFKSEVVLIVVILLLIDSWIRYKRSKLEKKDSQQNSEPETIASLTRKEIWSYYAIYFSIIMICVILNIVMELNGFKLDISSNFDNIMNGL